MSAQTSPTRASDGRPDDPFNGQCAIDDVPRKYACDNHTPLEDRIEAHYQDNRLPSAADVRGILKAPCGASSPQFSCFMCEGGDQCEACRRAHQSQHKGATPSHALPSELVDAVRAAADVIDGCLVNDETAMNSMEAVRNRLRAALRLPLPTVETVRAQEREKCAQDLEQRASSYPLGHEQPVRGASTYNWLKWAASHLRSRENA